MSTAAGAARRSLRLNSLDDLLTEIDRIAAAERAGTLRPVGNWTPGQVFGHLAAWINYAYEGFPVRVPWFIRILIRRKLKKYLAEGLPGGVRLPKVETGTCGVEVLPIDEGAVRLRAAVRRLQNGEPSKYDSPAFGPLTLEQRIALNLRHAELHLSHLVY